MEFTTRISPNGKEVLMLYYDDDPLMGLGGHKQVVRASNVRFDEDKQLWYVFERMPDGSEEKWPIGFAKRSDAIQCEIKMLEVRLVREDQTYFKGLFAPERKEPEGGQSSGSVASGS